MQKTTKILLVTLVVVFGILGVISLIKFGNLIFVIPVFLYFSNWLHNEMAVDIWLARAIVVLLVVPLLLSVKLTVSKNKKDREWGMGSLGVLLGLCFVGLFLQSGDHFFDHNTGQPIKWYTETPEGIRFYDSSGYDPKYGIELKPVTREVIERIPKVSTHAITKAKNERVITFAPGETKKIIELSPNEWSSWIKVPANSYCRTESPGGTLLKFIDGTIMEDSPTTYIGIKRGIIKFKGVGETIISIEPR